MLMNENTVQHLMNKHHTVGLSITTLDSLHTINSQSYGLLKKDEDLEVDTNSVFSAGSMSKFVTALLTLKLASMDLVNLDHDVNDYLIKVSINEGITLRHLLSHTSGIKDLEGSFGIQQSNERHKLVDLISGQTTYHKGPIEYI